MVCGEYSSAYGDLLTQSVGRYEELYREMPELCKMVDTIYGTDGFSRIASKYFKDENRLEMSMLASKKWNDWLIDGENDLLARIINFHWLNSTEDCYDKNHFVKIYISSHYIHNYCLFKYLFVK